VGSSGAEVLVLVVWAAELDVTAVVVGRTADDEELLV